MKTSTVIPLANQYVIYMMHGSSNSDGYEINLTKFEEPNLTQYNLTIYQEPNLTQLADHVNLLRSDHSR